MHKGLWAIIIGGAVVAMTGIKLINKNKKIKFSINGKKGDEKEAEMRKKQNEIASQNIKLEQKKKEIEESKNEIEKKKNMCWELHCKYMELQHESKRYKSLFQGDTGIIRYMQRLLGICYFDVNELSFNDLKYEVNELVISGIGKTIEKYPKKDFVYGDKEQHQRFIDNLDLGEIDENTPNEDIKKLGNRLDTIKQIKTKDINEINIEYYKNLYEALEKVMQEFDKLCKDNNNLSEEDYRKRLFYYIKKIITLFKEYNISFYIFEEANNEDDLEKVKSWFRILDSADCCPVVMREDVEEIIIKGKVTNDFISKFNKFKLRQL